jgi:hypothetical protein
MKPERRHELQDNYLADYLGKWLTTIEPYAKPIAAAAGAAAIGLVGWALLRGNEMGKRSDATLQLLQNSAASDAEALKVVGQLVPGTPVAAMANLLQADTLLAEGINALFEDREDAEKRIAESIDSYTVVRDTAGADPLVVSRANLGLARAHESLGKIDDAVKAYGEVVRLKESDAIVKIAENRIAELKNPATTEFLTWFAKQDFKPATPATPPGSPSGSLLPDNPNVALPDLQGLLDKAKAESATLSEEPQPKGDEPSPKPDEAEPKADTPEPKADAPAEPKADTPEPEADAPEAKPEGTEGSVQPKAEPAAPAPPATPEAPPATPEAPPAESPSKSE